MKYRHRILAIMLAGLSVPAFAADANPPGPQGGPGASLDRRQPLSEAQRKLLQGMTPEQRQQYFQRLRHEHQARRQDRDNNPPGAAGGPGTNWENPPGPQGGPGASPDHRPLSEAQRKLLQGMTPEQRQQYFQRLRQEHPARRQDRDNNPPGAAGGPGTNWENPPGPQGGSGASPDRRPPPGK